MHKLTTLIRAVAKKIYLFCFEAKSWLLYNIYGLENTPSNLKNTSAQPVWIVGERNGQHAGDNGFVLFSYLQAHHADHIQSYFVLRKSAPQYQKLKNHPSVLTYNSKEHLVLFKQSHVILFTDKLKDVCDNNRLVKSIRSQDSMALRTFVMLHHGVMYLKSTSFENYHSKKFGIPIDVFVANSEFEKRNLIKFSGYDEDQVAVVGFPRFDSLQQYSDSKKYILFMPTWRRGMKYWTKHDFMDSFYYQRIQSILTKEELITTLKKYDFHLKFYVHFNMLQWIDTFKSHSEHVQIENPETANVTDLLNHCAMLVTDFSTISFDVIYMNKSVAFFDLGLETEDLLGQSPISENFEEEIFGPVFNEESRLIDEIKSNLENNFELNSDYLQRRELFFKFIDANNSKRVTDHILDVSTAKLRSQLENGDLDLGH